jgi:hypothetical protein
MTEDLTKTQGMGRSDPTKTKGTMGPDAVKTQGLGGAGDSGGQLSGGNVVTTVGSSRQGSVIIRATVEHAGVVGDTEMTVSVKWPASSFCAPCCENQSSSEEQESQSVQGTGNGPNSFILFEPKENAPRETGGARQEDTKKNPYPPKKVIHPG